MTMDSMDDLNDTMNLGSQFSISQKYPSAQGDKGIKVPDKSKPNTDSEMFSFLMTKAKDC